jgi:hypothetical protein
LNATRPLSSREPGPCARSTTRCRLIRLSLLPPSFVSRILRSEGFLQNQYDASGEREYDCNPNHRARPRMLPSHRKTTSEASNGFGGKPSPRGASDRRLRWHLVVTHLPVRISLRSDGDPFACVDYFAGYAFVRWSACLFFGPAHEKTNQASAMINIVRDLEALAFPWRPRYWRSALNSTRCA